MAASREDIQRVSIDSMADWERIENNYRTAVLSELRSQIAAKGVQGEQETLLAYAQRFLDRTLMLAHPNLRVNGHNFEALKDGQPDVEPFDEALDRRIWSLAAHRQGCHKAIAETRRTTPTKIANSIDELYEHEHKMERGIPDILQADENAEDMTLDDDIDEGQTEGFYKASAMAEELVQTMPSQVERSERLEEVAFEIKNLKP
ncbi:hypothetical protein E1B28_004060 [Marasmius oreades]|uniref:Uncharacterized protein n=1 Tax=Marasmius oreades TaxID=181124 RepID=A0A9P8ACD8_9AGAR|nr:uncharacterized protein E1B28_004060 [Marasmius oreades]KAG7096644.1 hypothetical protein E1B28_004060 [Marasmius oreades]